MLTCNFTASTLIRAGGPKSTVDPDKESFNKLLSQRDLGLYTESDDKKDKEMKLDIKLGIELDIKSEIESESELNKIAQHTHDVKFLCGWRRVCGVDQIRRVVEGLGDSTSDQELRINLVTSLLADRRGPDVVGMFLHAYIRDIYSSCGE